jgi:dihydroorotate dehydrogenase
VLTYKTVRSGHRECYPLPNLQPVRCSQLHGAETDLPAVDEMAGSWAVSFGMPSQEPHVWRADIERTRAKLPRGKLLSVSVVGTIQEGWTIDDLAADYARCALWAVESGADCVEVNFSCPNVSTCDGQLYQDPAGAALVAGRVRCEIGKKPLIVKIGRVASAEDAQALLDALRPHVDALAMTNSIATFVVGRDGQTLFDGQRRGICGSATFQASLAQVAIFDRLQNERGPAAKRLDLIGVGGASTADHVRQYLAAGASAVHLATAVMVDPEVGLKIRRELA